MPLFPPRLLALAALSWLAPGAAAQPPTPSTYTVYAAGDIADCGQRPPAWSRAAITADLVEKALAAEPNAAVLLLGDNVYERGTAAEFARCYAPTWGRFKDRTWPAPGNHEYATEGASGYFAYFGQAAGRGYYQLKLGSWRVFSLDSNLAPAEHAAQLAWLRAELARAPAQCTLAYWHHPLYSSGGHGSNAKMAAAWTLLQEAGAEIVLSGHDHHYERFAPQDARGKADPRGIRQFVVGTGGAYTTPLFPLALANSERRDAARSGVLKLVLAPQGYTWEFLEATNDGLPNGPAPDRGAGQCHSLFGA